MGSTDEQQVGESEVRIFILSPLLEGLNGLPATLPKPKLQLHVLSYNHNYSLGILLTTPSPAPFGLEVVKNTVLAIVRVASPSFLSPLNCDHIM